MKAILACLLLGAVATLDAVFAGTTDNVRTSDPPNDGILAGQGSLVTKVESTKQKTDRRPLIEDESVTSDDADESNVNEKTVSEIHGHPMKQEHPKPNISDADKNDKIDGHGDETNLVKKDEPNVRPPENKDKKRTTKPPEVVPHPLLSAGNSKVAASVSQTVFNAVAQDGPEGFRCGVQAKGYEPTGIGAAWKEGMNEHSWPWTLLLKAYEDPYDECIAGLIPVRNNKIESDMFVTSAKCVTKYREEVTRIDDPEEPGRTKKQFKYHSEYRDPEDFRVFAGLHEKNTLYNKLRVKKFLPHPDYSGKSPDGKDIFHNDIAVGKLEETIKFNDEKIPICLPKLTLNLRESDCMTAIWRKQSLELLKQMDVVVGTSDLCNDAGGNYKKDMMLCGASHYSQIKFDHDADSGAVLSCRENENIRDDPDGIWYFFGAAMSGYKLRNNVPLMFTRVKTYVEWIEDAVKNLTSIPPEEVNDL